MDNGNRMTDKQTNNILLKLRFPEFEDNKRWSYVHGNELFVPIVKKNRNSDLPVLAITQNQGAVPREMIDYNVIVSEKSIAGYKVVEVGDFIISLRSFQGGIEYSNYNGLCSPAYIILRKKDETICNDFYRHYFKSYRFIQDLNRNLEGIRDGKMISYQQFSEILIPYPPLAEQQRIANCLSSIDSYISSINKKIEQLKAHKKSLLQKLFPQNGQTLPEYRFPEFKSAGVWKEIKFGDVFSRITEKNTKNCQNVLTISAQYGLVSQYDYFHKNVAASDISNYYLIQKGDFAYNKSRSQGYPFGAIRSLRLYDEGVVSTLYICFRIKGDKYSVDFFDHYFETELINVEIGKIAQEGARNHGLLNISTDDFFNKIVLLIPSPSEQKKISDFLSSIDKTIFFYVQKASLLEQQKTGLIQQLFPTL